MDARQGLTRFSFVLLTALVPVAAAAATVTGAVRISGPPPAASAVRVGVDAAVCGVEMPDESLVVGPGNGVRDAVVVLRPAEPRPPGPPPAAEALVDNTRCRFVPRVQVVRRGQVVRVRNSDPVLHNARATVVGPPAVAVANLALSRAGQTMDLTRRLAARLPAGAEEAVVALGCDVHPWMRGWLVVVDHPRAAVTDAAGRWSLADVPAGRWTLAVWHETLGRHERPLEVGADGRVTADVTLPVR